MGIKHPLISLNLGDQVEPAFQSGYEYRGAGVVTGFQGQSILVTHNEWREGHNGGDLFSTTARERLPHLNASWWYREEQLAPQGKAIAVETSPWWETER